MATAPDRARPSLLARLRSFAPARGAVPAALLLAALLTALNLLTAGPTGMGFLVLAPLLCAAWGGSPAQVTGVAVLVTALALVLGVEDGIFGERLHVVILVFEVAGGGLAVYVALLRRQREEDQARLEIQFATARALQEAGTSTTAAGTLLGTITPALGWEVGTLWEVRHGQVLDHVASWSHEEIDPAALGKLERQFVARPAAGLPGGAIETAQPAWADDLAEQGGTPRAELAMAAGLRSAAAIPLTTGRGVVGLMELFGREVRDGGRQDTELLRALGGQIGEFVEVQRGGEALRESEARKSAVLESALDCVVTMDHEGRIVEFNPAAERTFGYPREEAIGADLADLLMPPGLREQHRKGLRRYLDTRESELLGNRVEMRGVTSEGREFPVELAIARIGERWPPMFTGYIRDISERRRAEEERDRLLQRERLARSEADTAHGQLAAILRGVADAVTAHAPDGSLVFANDSAVRVLGFESVEELLETPPSQLRERFEMYDEDGEPFPAEQLPGRRALLGEPSPEALVRHVNRRDGRERWSMVKATPILDETGDVTMAINVMEDITELKRAEQGQRVLAECGRVLSSSMEISGNLNEVARQLVPALADWSAIHLLHEDGHTELEAYAAANAEIERLELDLVERFPPTPDAPVGIPYTLRTGRSTLHPEITAEFIEARATSPEQAEILRSIGTHSKLVAPLSSRGRVLGALALVRLGGRRLDEDDLAVAEEIGRRVGAAVDNARLYAERSYIARTLQQSLLPAELPSIPFIQAAARFHAAGEGNEVGGDFYDLFESGGGRWSIVVGDVCGKGPDAAAVTALARYTLRAAAMREPSPSAGLRVLNEALLRQRTDLRFATVAYASLFPTVDGARLEVASAGHPLPLVLRKNGSVEPIGLPGTLVGVVPDPDITDAGAQLEEGDSLIFYTDGVVEARGDSGFFGERRLRELVEGCAGLDADRIAATIEAAAVELQRGEPRDDIAVVVLRVLRETAVLPKG